VPKSKLQASAAYYDLYDFDDMVFDDNFEIKQQPPATALPKQPVTTSNDEDTDDGESLFLSLLHSQLYFAGLQPFPKQPKRNICSDTESFLFAVSHRNPTSKIDPESSPFCLELNLDYEYGYDYDKIIKNRLKAVNEAFNKDSTPVVKANTRISFDNTVSAINEQAAMGNKKPSDDDIPEVGEDLGEWLWWQGGPIEPFQILSRQKSRTTRSLPN
jgi:hypothetical protein